MFPVLRQIGFFLLLAIAASPGIYTLTLVFSQGYDRIDDVVRPVLAAQTRFADREKCGEGMFDNDYCWDLGPLTFVTYPSFDQSTAYCYGEDAVLVGVMNKVRPEPFHSIEAFGYRAGRFGPRFDIEFMSSGGQVRPPVTRPIGVQDWGPMRLIGACASGFTQWSGVVTHIRSRSYDGNGVQVFERLVEYRLGVFDLPSADPEG